LQSNENVQDLAKKNRYFGLSFLSYQGIDMAGRISGPGKIIPLIFIS